MRATFEWIQRIKLRVDGHTHDVHADAATPPLYALRDDLNLENPRFGCGLAQCGACTVHVGCNLH